MFAATEPELPLPSVSAPFKPAPLANAFPQLVGKASDERPFLTPWLTLATVIGINDDGIKVLVTPDHMEAFRGLTQPNVHSYLNRLLQEEWKNDKALIEFTTAASVDIALGNPPPAKAAVRYNKLTLQQQIKLADWVRQISERAKTDPDTHLAALAQIDLGFTITPANFTSTREALEIQKVKPGTPPTLDERLENLEKGLADALSRLATLEGTAAQ